MVDEQLLESLDRNGFAVVRDVIAAPDVAELRRWSLELVDEDLAWRLAEVERRRAAGESDVRAFPRDEEGRFHLQRRDDHRHRQLVAGIADIAAAIGTPEAGTHIGIEACLPGWGGHEGLHDELTGPAARVGAWDGAVFVWPLTTGWRGMRFVPGSHRRDPVFEQRFAGAIAPHPDEVHPDAETGDVLIYSLHVWKSATINTTTDVRAETCVVFRRDDSVRAAHAARWEQAEIFESGGVPWEPGNVVVRDTNSR